MTLTLNSRTAERPIEKVFLERWSPRAFTDGVISEEELLTILEAARWAPSAYNVQPSRERRPRTNVRSAPCSKRSTGSRLALRENFIWLEIA